MGVALKLKIVPVGVSDFRFALGYVDCAVSRAHVGETEGRTQLNEPATSAMKFASDVAVVRRRRALRDRRTQVLRSVAGGGAAMR